MGTVSVFTDEDQDIVKLESTSDDGSRMGWVNVGTHAVQLTLDANGALTVEVCARTNEARPLGACVVTKQASIEAGGVDPDCEVDEPRAISA
jgi:hypothetical protein